MLKRGILLATLIFLILVLANVEAQTQQKLGEFQEGQCINLKQTCSNCTFVNITRVSYPNSTDAIKGNFVMDKVGSVYNYTFCETPDTGEYIVDWIADPDDITTAGNYDFTICNEGGCLDFDEALIYIFVSIGIFLLFLICLYASLNIPYRNIFNDKGSMIIKITKSKYLKLLFILITLPLFLWFINILVALSTNFLDLDLFSGFFKFIFISLNSLVLPYSIVVMVIFFFEIIRDINYMKLIKEVTGNFGSQI